MPYKSQMFLMNMLMMAFAFSMKDEEDEDYEPKVMVRNILTRIPKFPDISAFGPKSIGALQLLNNCMARGGALTGARQWWPRRILRLTFSGPAWLS